MSSLCQKLMLGCRSALELLELDDVPSAERSRNHLYHYELITFYGKTVILSTSFPHNGSAVHKPVVIGFSFTNNTT